MSSTQTKNIQNKNDKKIKGKSNADIIFYALAIVAVFLGLYFLPELIGSANLSFLSTGSGLNKLLTFLLSVLVGWVALLPSSGYKRLSLLSKGAIVEWKKSIKPDKDTVLKTTMMIFLIVGIFALLILLLDWIFASVLKAVL